MPAACSMPRSLAPSPTARTSAAVIPIRVVISSSACTLAARPRIGSATVPVRRPSATCRVLARCSSKPSDLATRAVKAVKPPDTKAARAPCARIVATSVRPPGIIVMRFVNTRSITVSGSPFKSATRSRSAPSKANSPFIARSVIAATRAPTPASAASSSMHSCRIMVESISASSSRFLRFSAGTMHRSVPIACSDFHTPQRFSGTTGTANSAATPGFSQTASAPPQALRSASTVSRSSVGCAGSHSRMARAVEARPSSTRSPTTRFPPRPQSARLWSSDRHRQTDRRSLRSFQRRRLTHQHLKRVRVGHSVFRDC